MDDSQMLLIRPAAVSDVPLLLRFSREFAEYKAGGRASIPKNAWAPYPCGFHQARRIPQEGQEAWEERSRRVAPQKGQTVSAAGGIAASFSWREGSLEVRSRWTSVRMAPRGRATRIAQWKTSGSSGSGDTAHTAAVKMSRTTKPAHLNPRRVPGCT